MQKKTRLFLRSFGFQHNIRRAGTSVQQRGTRVRKARALFFLIFRGSGVPDFRISGVPGFPGFRLKGRVFHSSAD